MSRPRPSRRDQFHVAIICALSLEYNAVSIVFDHFWDDEGDSYGRAPGDLNTYTTGCIGGHNVVLALLSHMGKANAASAAASLRSSYEGLKLVLLVGVCGGMPYNQFGEEVLLGDVIIGKSVIQHDFGRRYPDGFVPKDEDEDRLQKPDKLVRNLLAVFETDRGLELLENRTSNFLKEVQSRASSKRRRVNYGYPGANEDKLFESAYRHKHHSSTACICRDSHKDSDPVCTEAPTSLCFDLGCSDSHLVPRTRLMELDGASTDSACRPAVHVGRIASGDTVIKSAGDRDNISKKTKAIGFEMEGAGIWEEFSCIMVIKGVCDYADSHKSKLWQTYAAATAAAASKAVLKRYIHTDVPSEAMKDTSQSIISPDHKLYLVQALPEECQFVGRESDLQMLDEIVGVHPGRLPSKSAVALWGLAGVGKSQLVSQFVKRQQHKWSSRAIFWISGESEQSFDKSVISLLKDSHGMVGEASNGSAVAPEQRELLIRGFFSELGSSALAGALLIIDGLSGPLGSRLKGYLGGLGGVSMIFTTRSRDLAYQFPRKMEIGGLEETDAVTFLRSSVDNGFRGSEADVRDLARLLKYHPLSLKVAASLMARNPQSIAQYVEKWKSRSLSNEALSTHDSLLRAFELSFEELRQTSPMSANLLLMFSFLDHRDMWYELCLGMADESSPPWLQHLSAHKRPRDYISPLHDLSFIEAKPHDQLGCIYEIHPAVHEFARWKAGEDEVEYLTTAITLVAAHVPRSTDHDFITITQRLEPHVSQCMLYIQQDRTGDRLDLVELEKFGNLFRHVGRYDEAFQLYRVVLQYLRRDEPSQFNLEMMANIENNIGLVHHAKREYEKALQAYERSSHLRRQCFPTPNQDTLVSTFYNEGRSLLVLSRLEEAQRKLSAAAGYFFQAMNDDSRPRGEREQLAHPYQRILNDLGETHLRIGQLDEAEQVLHKAFRGHLESGREQHPTAFAIRLNMGRVCVERNFFASSRSIFEHIIATYTEWWGRRHPETMRALNELAESYMRHGKSKREMGDGSEEELKRSLECFTETLLFYEETFGKEADIVGLIRSKLEELTWLRSSIAKSPYEIYYAPPQP